MITYEQCQALDHADPLASVRDLFDHPRPREGHRERIYLDANSVGAMPKAAPDRLLELMREGWSRNRRRSWADGDWLSAPTRLGDRIAPLIGANAGEVLVCDSTSINLFKLLAGALQLRPGRAVIVSEAGNFPTDLYIAQGLRDLLGGACELRLVPEGRDPADFVDQETAVLSLSLVDYRSSRRFDMARLTQAAHQAGALVLWDLSHAAGAIPIDLNATDADLAIGCTYKYLCGGPGSPAFLFTAQRHQQAMKPALTGWMGHAAQFDFETAYRPAPGIKRQLCGTPAVLANAALETALEIWSTVSLDAVHAKHAGLSALMIDLLDQRCPAVTLVSPRDYANQGGHIAVRHEGGAALVEALAQLGVICSHRAPDTVRFGLAPLTLRHVDIWHTVIRLEEVLTAQSWRTVELGAAT
ncbi:MAG: kynureninase [Alphaproteobacteria bacterium]